MKFYINFNYNDQQGAFLKKNQTKVFLILYKQIFSTEESLYEYVQMIPIKSLSDKQKKDIKHWLRNYYSLFKLMFYFKIYKQNNLKDNKKELNLLLNICNGLLNQRMIDLLLDLAGLAEATISNQA